MKVALTGGTGFIGQHVRKLLAKSEHEVLLVVRKHAKIDELGVNEKFVIADISEDREDWFDYLDQPDVLLHLAWGGLPNYLDNYHVEVELPLQSKFLSKVVSSGLRKLVVTGTCYEYGLATGALSESQETNPNTPYGIAKDLLRRELFEFQLTQKFELTWARIFYPYGEGQSEKSLYSQLKICSNSEIGCFDIYNSDSKLDFVPVETVASSLLKLLEQRGFGLINIGSGEPRSVFDFAKDLIYENSWQISLRVTENNGRDFESKAFWAGVKNTV
jgi:nucleoside-diphosphate-sugar epimerase